MAQTRKETLLLASMALGIASELAGGMYDALFLHLVGLLLMLPFLFIYWSMPFVLLWQAGRSLIHSRRPHDLLQAPFNWRAWWPARPIPRFLFAHGVASVLFFPLCLNLLPLIRPTFAGNVLPGVNVTPALIGAPAAAPLVLGSATLADLTSRRFPQVPSSAWLWPNYLLPLIAIYAALSLPHWRQERRAKHRAQGRCPACGYDLRASPDRCPECGQSVQTRP